ncbi:PREDICTED: alpha-L-fucosidase-like [Ceratosolen solmsi marchali]|uniref:Putative alpha-L-fucosidase n=1 Tax=Ceratosolen solmsi marchali TaxID=326594 RepID=A0AAJ6YNN1_9HYME|nr:PREDICTED: alpha-L-fucosidase-like [Ceratosolen solmsi marchali]
MVILQSLLFLCFMGSFYNSINSYYSIFVQSSSIETNINSTNNFNTKYEPTWKSLDSRPLPTWFDDAKFGIFIHWGVFSVPSFGSEWFWINWKNGNSKYERFMKNHYKPNFTYQEFANDFTAEFFNATKWSELFEASGAKYVVITSKHHEGYTLWPSKYSFSWNSLDVGPRKDLIGELSTAIKKHTNLKFGLYHSLFEWFNPLYLQDKKNNFSTDFFVTNKIIPEMKEMIELYEPQILWSDGDWEATAEYWKSQEFLAWLYNESPVKDSVVTNDRWGINIGCKHGDFYNCQDRYNPGVLQKHKWENAMTIDRKSWGFRRNAPLEDYFSLKELIKELVITVSTGGNLLMNVGPTKDGIISPIFEERLRDMGRWLKINGKAIYESRPWILQNDTVAKDVWYTHGKTGALYATLLSWPTNNTVTLSNILKMTDKTKISLLNSNELIKWRNREKYIDIYLPSIDNKGEPAWVLEITNFHY